MTRVLLALALVAAVLGCASAPPASDAPRSKPAAAASKAQAAKPPPAPAKNGASKQAAQAASASTATAQAAAATAAADAAPIPPRAQRLFEEAVKAEEEQRKLKVPTDWAYLERKWRAVLDAAEVAEARFNLGVTLEGQGRLDEARAEYARARETKPSLRQAAVNLAVLLERQGDAPAAAEAYAQVIREFPEDGAARARLAALYRRAGQLDDAWRLAREALVREPRTVGAYRMLARVALQKNELDLAKLIALRAEKLEAADPELPWVVGQVLARQGDEGGAQAQFRKALSLREGFLPARYALLDGALKKRAWGAVAEHAAAILKLEPQNAQVQLAHGLALRYTGKPDEALAAYDRAQAAGGDRLADVHLARGVLLARVKSECAPALEELKLYTARAGPVLPEGSQVTKLQRDCEAQLEESRKAAEAARLMQEEAAKKKAQPVKDAAPAKDPNTAKDPGSRDPNAAKGGAPR